MNDDGFLVLMLVIVVAVGDTVTPAMGQYDKVFEELQTDNHWDTGENWSPPGEPGANDSVNIPATESCVIHNAGSDAVAELVDVAGTLTIEKTRKLTFTEDSAVKTGGGVVGLYGTLTMNADLTIEGASSGDAGDLRLHRNTGASIDSLVKGTGEITVDGGNVPGLLEGSGTVNVEILNNGQIQAGGDFPSIEVYLSFNQPVVGGAGSNFLSTYGIVIEFEGGVSGSGDWHTPTYRGAGGHCYNAFNIPTVSCVSANIYIPHGFLRVEDNFCTSGELEMGSDNVLALPQIVVWSGKTAKFNVAACACTQ